MSTHGSLVGATSLQLYHSFVVQHVVTRTRKCDVIRVRTDLHLNACRY